MKLNLDILKNLLRAVLRTHDEELSCGECYEKIDTFIEMKLEGKSPAQAMPLVQEHLDHCGECREEYEALLTALQKIENGKNK